MSLPTLYRAIRQKRLRAARIGGGRSLRLREDWLREWRQRGVESGS